MHPLELKINDLIQELETGFLDGSVSSRDPIRCLEKYTEIGAYLSMCIGLIEKLETLKAEYFVLRKGQDEKLSQLAMGKEWKVSSEGRRMDFWETRISRIKVLMEILEKNYYQGRSEAQIKNLL